MQCDFLQAIQSMSITELSMFFPYLFFWTGFSFYSHSPHSLKSESPSLLGFPSLSCTWSQSSPKFSLLWSLTHINSLLANLLPSTVLPAFPWLTVTQVTLLSIAFIRRWTQNVSMVLFLLTIPRCNTHIYTEIGEKYIYFLSIKWEHQSMSHSKLSRLIYNCVYSSI